MISKGLKADSSVSVFIWTPCDRADRTREQTTHLNVEHQSSKIDGITAILHIGRVHSIISVAKLYHASYRIAHATIVLDAQILQSLAERLLLLMRD